MEATQPGILLLDGMPDEVGSEETGEGALIGRLDLAVTGTLSRVVGCTGLPCETGVSEVELDAGTAAEAPAGFQDEKLVLLSFVVLYRRSEIFRQANQCDSGDLF